MTEPTQAKRSAAASVARITADAMLREKRDTGLKSIFSKAEIKIIDKWIVGNDPTLNRTEAIRRLVELGLKVKGEITARGKTDAQSPPFRCC